MQVDFSRIYSPIPRIVHKLWAISFSIASIHSQHNSTTG